jgi:hypothetical protein
MNYFKVLYVFQFIIIELNLDNISQLLIYSYNKEKCFAKLL